MEPAGGAEALSDQGRCGTPILLNERKSEVRRLREVYTTKQAYLVVGFPALVRTYARNKGGGPVYVVVVGAMGERSTLALEFPQYSSNGSYVPPGGSTQTLQPTFSNSSAGEPEQLFSV